MLVEWNQPPGWTSFSASAQPAVQVQLLDVHLKLHKATNRVKLSHIKDIYNVTLLCCASNRSTVHVKMKKNLSITNRKNRFYI